MFKNMASIVIKFKGNIEIIPKIKTNVNIQSTKNKPKYNKTNVPISVVEFEDEYIKRIIKNGGL
jgi:hypothetical protein